MRHEIAELISNYDGEIYENYSGRGMYGSTTTALTFGSEKDFYRALADAMSDAISDGDQQQGHLLCELLRNVKTDSLGLNLIIY